VDASAKCGCDRAKPSGRNTRFQLATEDMTMSRTQEDRVIEGIARPELGERQLDPVHTWRSNDHA
jgi:hypothetical protein